jgi:hypothetical protein
VARAAAESGAVLWDQIPGYDRLVRAMLVEMRRRPVAQWPESMQQAALALLCNEKLVKPFSAVVLRKMTAQRTASVAATLDVLSVWLFALQARGAVPLPAHLDFDLLLKRIRTLLCADHFKILTWCASTSRRRRVARRAGCLPAFGCV